MNSVTRGTCARHLLVSLAALAFAGCATVVNSAPSPQASASEPAPVQSAAPDTMAGHLRQLMDSHQLTELRTTYNGTYGASLLLQPDRLTYFAVLFHDKTIWRVIQNDSEKSAEAVYRTFAAQTEQLAQPDIDTLRLQAGQKYAAKMVEMNEQRLQSLQQDAARQQEQSKKVAEQQEQAKQQAASLSGDLRATSNQLGSIEQRIHQLMEQQANPELVLPAASEGTAPASASSVPAPAPAVSPATAAPSH